MTERDPETGRFARHDPFVAGAMVDQDMLDSSRDTETALNRALTQAESDLANWIGRA